MSHGGEIKGIAQELELDPSEICDFSTNLNIFAPDIPHNIWQAFQANVKVYPDCQNKFLEKRLSEIYSIDKNRILSTAGGIEALSLVFQHFKNTDCHLFYPTFNAYKDLASNNHSNTILHHSDIEDNNSFPFNDIPQNPSLAVICNPCNPTGNLIPKKRLIKAINQNKDVTWLIDEAFIEFTENPEENSLAPHLSDLKNLILVRSLTKSWNIPGLRLGFAASSNQQLIADLTKIQIPWSINGITIAWAEQFLNKKHSDIITQSLQLYQVIRNKFYSQLNKIMWLKAYPSKTNFFLVKVEAPNINVDTLFNHLIKNGILVRKLGALEGFTEGEFFRVAIRDQEDNQRLINTLKNLKSS